MNLDNYELSSDRLKVRLQAAMWHGGIMTTIAVLNIVATNLEVFSMPAWLVLLLSTVIPQITKLIRNYYDEEAFLAELDSPVSGWYTSQFTSYAKEEVKKSAKSTKSTKPTKKTKKSGKK